MNLFSPDVSKLENFYDKGRYLLAWRISVVLAIFFLPLVITYSIVSPKSLVPAISALFLATSSLFFLHKTKNYKPIYWFFTLGGSSVAIFTICFVDELTHYVDFLWIICVILFGFIGLGKKTGILLIILNSIGIGFFFFLFLNNHIVNIKPRSTSLLISEYIEILTAFFVFSYLVSQFVSFQSNTQNALASANADLEKQYNLISSKSHENEILLKEIHHRVKNNFQIIISLLRMQSLEMKTEEGKTHFKEAISRIMAMSLIHQKLYTEKELSKIDLKSYLNELVNEIANYSSQEKEIKFNIQTELQGMDLISVVPLGLLINELLSNSFKHAFTNCSGNEIDITVNRSKNGFDLIYTDNGTWRESEMRFSNFGLELIDILTEQLNGTKKLDTTEGTKYHFKLNAPDK